MSDERLVVRNFKAALKDQGSFFYPVNLTGISAFGLTQTGS